MEDGSRPRVDTINLCFGSGTFFSLLSLTLPDRACCDIFNFFREERVDLDEKNQHVLLAGICEWVQKKTVGLQWRYMLY